MNEGFFQHKATVATTHHLVNCFPRTIDCLLTLLTVTIAFSGNLKIIGVGFIAIAEIRKAFIVSEAGVQS
ncbi:unnamed protein product [Lactuca virosa]|uniref:Uncharacterized protein n=1 Tax=Lactuca virosa TaxID=75947 RepID=A0AAU9LQB0_9ASTR|nr:unnamed protein product [Lactuca virosa]